MTRKEELEERAEDLASGPVSPYEVYAALAKVEREVWEKVIRHIGGWRECDEPEDWPLELWRFVGGERDKLADWARAQQQELT